MPAERSGNVMGPEKHDKEQREAPRRPRWQCDSIEVEDRTSEV